MSEQFHDLKWERLEDGSVRLEQQTLGGNACAIDAHPVQIIHIARTLTAGNSSSHADRIATLERRLRWLYDRFLEVYEELPTEKLFAHYPDASEFYTWLNASIDVAAEYCADLTHPQKSE